MNRCKTLGLLGALLSFLFNVAPPVRPKAPHAEPPTKPAGITASATAPADAIRFSYQPIDFQLETDETPERHTTDNMAGGVAVFDYNNDGKLDIFFTNGADIHTLRKSSPKYRNRLFQNDGKGHFTDVTDKAGLAGP